MKRFPCIVLASLLLTAASTLAQSPADTASPRALIPNLTIRRYVQAGPNAVRIALEPHTGYLVYATADGGIYRIYPGIDSARSQRLYTSADHGMEAVSGIAFDAEGTIYLVGNHFVDSSLNVATIKRGTLLPGDSTKRTWSIIAQTVPYPRSNTNYDHTFSGIVVSPDGKYLYVNSGSRTDHGELQTNHGLYPGLREVPLTSAIFRLPANSTDIILQNDEQQLKSAGYLFADGTRNSFDLRFAANGDLFAADNSGDRDDNEELNWIREGHHYGFPWRMGTANTPQQYPGYDPAKDLLVNKQSYGSLGGFYYNDPTYPAPPPGVTFTDPIGNIGPDALKYRDSATGNVMIASSLSTFTAHRSPLGLVFDVANAMPGFYRGEGFITSWTDGRAGGSELLTPFNEDSQDLMSLRMNRDDSGYVISAQRIADGFNQPIDAEIVANKIYILEYAGAHMIWEVTFVLPTSVETGHAAAIRPPAPNPFSDISRFMIAVPSRQHLSIDLVDLLGRTVRRLCNDQVPAGEQWFSIDARGLANGAYTVQITGDTIRESLPVRVVR